jgi:hypothetical protein
VTSRSDNLAARLQSISIARAFGAFKKAAARKAAEVEMMAPIATLVAAMCSLPTRKQALASFDGPRS